MISFVRSFVASSDDSVGSFDSDDVAKRFDFDAEYFGFEFVLQIDFDVEFEYESAAVDIAVATDCFRRNSDFFKFLDSYQNPRFPDNLHY